MLNTALLLNNASSMVNLILRSSRNCRLDDGKAVYANDKTAFTYDSGPRLAARIDRISRASDFKSKNSQAMLRVESAERRKRGRKVGRKKGRSDGMRSC